MSLIFPAPGFTFNKQFTDDKASCMVVNDDTDFMLLTEPAGVAIGT